MIKTLCARAVLNLYLWMDGKNRLRDKTALWLIRHIFDRNGDYTRGYIEALKKMKEEECADNDGSTR